MCRRRVRLSPPTVSRGIYPTEICRGVCLYKHPSNCTVFTDIRTHLYAPSWVGRLLVNRDVCYPKSRVQQHQWTRNGRSKFGTSYSALLSLNLLSRIEVWLLRPFLYIYIYPYIFKPEKWKKKSQVRELHRLIVSQIWIGFMRGQWHYILIVQSLWRTASHRTRRGAVKIRFGFPPVDRWSGWRDWSRYISRLGASWTPAS